MSFGVVDKIYHEEYLSDYVCDSCQKNLDTKFVVYCKAFVTGPITWWGWNKNGYTECNNCGKVSYVNTKDRSFQAVRGIYSGKPIPFFYFVPSVILGLLTFIVVGGISIGVIYNLSTNNEEKFQGTWLNKDGSSGIFVFKNHEYTLLERDTILFGKYSFDESSNIVRISIDGHGNKLDKINFQNLALKATYGMDENFMKVVAAQKKENPYQLKYNRWRIKPSHEETKAEIKERVIQYLIFLKVRYEWVIANNIPSLLPDINSPLFEAQNGIALYQDSFHKWRSAFFSEDNYNAGNTFLHLCFPGTYKSDEKERNIFKRNLGVINAFIKNAKSTDLP